VLNDSYMLYPMDPKAQKKDSDEKDENLEKTTNISSNVNKKNQFEEHLYQCEDERYEVSVVLHAIFEAFCSCNLVSC